MLLCHCDPMMPLGIFRYPQAGANGVSTGQDVVVAWSPKPDDNIWPKNLCGMLPGQSIFLFHAGELTPQTMFGPTKSLDAELEFQGLEAAQELDFRCPQFGFSQSFRAGQGEHGMSNRLPFVITNPPKAGWTWHR